MDPRFFRKFADIINEAEQVNEWGYNPPRDYEREEEYRKKREEIEAAYRKANPVEPKPSKTLQRLKRIQGFDKVSPDEQARVATVVDKYLARGMTFDQALVLAQK